MRLRFSALALMLAAFVGGTARAAPVEGDFGTPPRLLPYSGVLEQNGEPFTGTVDMTFYLVANVDDGLGAAIWNETQTVTVNVGEFSVALGVTTPLTPAVLDSTEVFAGVRVEDIDLGGRQRIVSAPYALTAENAANFTVRQDLVVEGNAQVGSLDVLGATDFVVGAAWGTGGVLSTANGGSLELGSTGTPFIDFSNDAASDFDARLVLNNNNSVELQGAELVTSGGLVLADGTNLDDAPTLNCSCFTNPNPAIVIGAVVNESTMAVPAGFTVTGGGCVETGNIRSVVFSHSANPGTWTCRSLPSDLQFAASSSSILTAHVCGCRILY